MTDDDERISGIKRGDLVKYKDSYYVYNAGDGPEGTWAQIRIPDLMYGIRFRSKGRNRF